MRALVALVLVATAARPALAERAAVSLYDYEARAQLVAAYEQAGDYSSAYYQAAWLAWLGPRQCAESSAGARYLRDRRARDRAASKGGMEVAAVVAAMDAERHLSESCFNGVIAAQAERLRGQTADYITQVEKAAASQTRDPVVRMALVHLYVTLDDVLAVQGGAAGWRERLPVLFKAAGQAEAVCAWLPESPGAHRALGVVRARIAQLQSRPEPWETAIAECERAYRLDPGDQRLPEFLWTLNLRAGHWEQASRWEAACGLPWGRGQLDGRMATSGAGTRGPTPNQ
jgi:hypothetical protein